MFSVLTADEIRTLETLAGRLLASLEPGPTPE